MKMIKVLTTARRGSAISLLLSVLFTSNAYAIKKCQDAEGRWHYGDGAAAACDTSKVTELNNRGFIKGEEEAPKTKDQIEAERETLEKLEAIKAAKAAEKAERERILNVYQSEADIDRQLENQTYSVDSSITVHKVYLERMNAEVARLEEKGSTLKGGWKERNDEELAASKAKIAEFEKELKGLEKQKTDIKIRFAREKEMYRSIQKELEAEQL